MLHQMRLHGVRVNAAAFTNLTQDHLDYHESMEDYFAAKRLLFTEVMADDAVAVINIDNDPIVLTLEEPSVEDIENVEPQVLAIEYPIDMPAVPKAEVLQEKVPDLKPVDYQNRVRPALPDT